MADTLSKALTWTRWSECQKNLHLGKSRRRTRGDEVQHKTCESQIALSKYTKVVITFYNVMNVISSVGNSIALVGTGWGTTRRSPELINLRRGSHLPEEYQPPTLPAVISGAVGGSVQDMFVICGGLVRGKECHIWKPGQKQWTNSTGSRVIVLEYPRYHAMSVALSKYEFLILGGQDLQGASTSEVVDKFGARPGPDLPMPLQKSCAVAINETHFFVGGGYNSGKFFMPLLQA